MPPPKIERRYQISKFIARVSKPLVESSSILSLSVLGILPGALNHKVELSAVREPPDAGFHVYSMIVLNRQNGSNTGFLRSFHVQDDQIRRRVYKLGSLRKKLIRKCLPTLWSGSFRLAMSKGWTKGVRTHDVWVDLDLTNVLILEGPNLGREYRSGFLSDNFFMLLKGLRRRTVES